jgi:dihydroorotate dehydrogenase electron transfer subunit
LSDYLTAANSLRTTQLISVQSASPTVKTLSFRDKECARAKPGQFLMLWIPGVDEIPLSIMETSKDDVISVAVKKVGEATNALHAKKKNDTIGVRGPFGNNFTPKGRKLLMVGGGTGVAPLLFLTRRMISKRTHTTFVLGAKTKNELLFMSQLRRLPKNRFQLVTSTEDGSCGVMGLCTQPVDKILSKDKFDMIFSCGPEKMVSKVFKLAEEHRVGFEASLERLMRCSIGLCGSCVVGKYRVCTDGPVFDSKQLRQMSSEFGITKRDRYGQRVHLD